MSSRENGEICFIMNGLWAAVMCEYESGFGFESRFRAFWAGFGFRFGFRARKLGFEVPEFGSGFGFEMAGFAHHWWAAMIGLS